MKIILVGPSNRFHGGISSYLEVTAKSLAKQGHSVGLVLFDRLIPSFLYPGKDRINRNPRLDFEEERISTLHVMNYYNYAIPKRAKRRIKDFEPDFAIIHWWTFAVFPMSWAISRFLRICDCPIIYEMHEVIDQNDARVPLVSRISRGLGGRVLRSANKIAVHAQTDFELNRSHYGINEERMEIIPLANINKYGERESKITSRTKMSISQDSVILFFGLIREYKGVLPLIESFEKMENSDSVFLLIVGEIWDQKSAIMKAIRESPKSENIRLIDRFVDDSEISTIFSTADVLAMPYSRASQSAVGSIAMSYGIPVVAFDVGGLKDSISRYGNGLMVFPGDTDEFSKSLEVAINMPIQESGGFDIDGVMRNWVDLGKGLLKEKMDR
jgi:glycosyltransferase involved in cell wall biosynthesis